MEQSTYNSENKYVSIVNLVKKLLSLYIQDIKLTSAEKLSLLLSGVAVFAIAMAFLLLGVVFIAVSLAHLLETLIPAFWSYFIIGTIFVIAAVVLISFKKQLVIDPIARFVSKLFVDEPTQKPKQ